MTITTYTYNDIEYAKVFIDPSLEADAGDGSTVDKALKDLPEDLSSNKMYIIRRTKDSYSTTLAKSNFLTNVILTGIPKEGELFYDALTEEEATSQWVVTDTAPYANINFSTVESNVVTTGASVFSFCYNFRSLFDSSKYMHNFNYMINNRVPTDDEEEPRPDNTFIQIENCKFGVKDINVDDDTYLSSTEQLSQIPSSMSNYINSYNVGQLYLKNNIFNIDATHITLEGEEIIIIGEETFTFSNANNDAKIYAINHGADALDVSRITLFDNKALTLLNNTFNIFNTTYDSNCHYSSLAYFLEGDRDFNIGSNAINLIKYKTNPIMPASIMTITNATDNLSNAFAITHKSFKNAEELSANEYLSISLKKTYFDIYSNFLTE